MLSNYEINYRAGRELSIFAENDSQLYQYVHEHLDNINLSTLFFKTLKKYKQDVEDELVITDKETAFYVFADRHKEVIQRYKEERELH